MRDAGIEKGNHTGPIGAIVATDTGSLLADRDYFQTVVDQEGLLASPNLFAYTLSNGMLGEVSIRFGLTGPCLVIENPPSMLAGIRGALDMLRHGMCDTVVGGYCDVVGSEGQLGAVFLVMEKSDSHAELIFEDDTIYWHGSGQSDLESLMNKIITDRKKVC
jgi:3-oxoacyl-[acyl-carrier-protein] synthase II